MKKKKLKVSRNEFVDKKQDAKFELQLEKEASTRFENEDRRLKSENEGLFEMKNELLTQRNFISDKEFHVTGKERVEEWLYTVDRVFKGCGIINDEQKVLQASSFLRYVATVKPWKKQKKDVSWSDFCTSLIKQMAKKHKPTDHEFKLREMLKANRDIGSYVNEFRILMNQKSSMDETDKISYFTDGFSGLTSGYVKFCKPKTLEEAIEVAENYEAFKMSENPKNADISFAGSGFKSGFKVKVRNKPYLYKHKKDQKDHVEVVFDTGASSSIIGLNTAKKLALSILPSDKSINKADGSTNKVIGVTEEIELKMAETGANLSFIITYVSHSEFLLGKNIKLDSGEESDFETEINAYLADQEPDDIFSDEIIDCDAKLEFKQTNLKVLDNFLKQNEDVFAKSMKDLKECKNVKFDIDTTTETPVMPNPNRQNKTQ
ncbi:unnamed protein product [Brachionus calyciflorus]|uniref:Ty3 transposon capsid-like protein domain-containing protein n=1 Tax=Brachionus calyciflorus TaxID=104777 RepID=A0A814IEZ7_9BILA|nr:unnamed protein product [Brachionus calyciflorus]